MNQIPHIQIELEDLIADLRFARRADKMGRLALLAYCECKAWARRAAKPDVADTALTIFTENPCLSKEEFLERIDNLIALLERHQALYPRDANATSVSTPVPNRQLAHH